MKTPIHPLVVLLLGASFGGLFGAWLVWELAQVPNRAAILWGGAIGAVVIVGLLGIGAGCQWLYRTVPMIQHYTKTAYARGAAVGAGLGVIAGLAWPFMQHRAGEPLPNPNAEALVVGGLVAAVGFVVGCLVSVGRVILRRKRLPKDQRPGAG